jgi:hypothetical protein
LVVQLRYHRRKVLPAAHRVGVVGAQAGFTDGQGALKQGARGGQVTLLVQNDGEIVEAVGSVGVIGT